MIERRDMMTGMAAVAVMTFIQPQNAEAKTPKEAPNMETPIDTNYTPARKGIVTGKGIGDFDFLTGEWTIRHKRLKDGTKDEWQRFDSGATVHRVLNGMGSVEELRKADGSDMGMGVRVWLSQEKKWADHWTSAGHGVINAPQKGEFIDGDGVFITEEEVDGVKWLYRGVWDKIGDGTCRWHQSASSDGGKSWEWNWWMEWTRIGMSA
jgi:hypothetical protein